MITPLKDNIIAVPCEEVGRVGALWMPNNKLQSLRTHRKMLVLYAGPKAKQEGVESGVVVHCSESWGEQIIYKEKTMWFGRLRDVNGICEGVQLKDTAKYSD